LNRYAGSEHPALEQFSVLDEPTSFLDSWAEDEWLTRFRRIGEGRTTLILTHRFTTAMQADIIHMMSRGRIVGSGTHEALVRLGGLYATSWQAQIRAESPHHNGTAVPT
jgi:ATP-binding cassette subfamily B protein